MQGKWSIDALDPYNVPLTTHIGSRDNAQDAEQCAADYIALIAEDWEDGDGVVITDPEGKPYLLLNTKPE